MSKLKQEQDIAKRVTLVGAIWDAILGLAKVFAGYFSQSQALMADGIHSLSDLVTDVFVYFASANSRQGPDENHPYGHLRFETLTTVFLGMVLIIVALGIAYESIEAQTEGIQAQFTWYGLAALLMTIIVKEAIFHYTKKAGDQIGSKMLIANAWHSRSDALSSIAVLIGLVGVYFGYAWADMVASIVVALLISKMAVSMVWENLAELVDTAPDPKLMERIKETANSLKHVMAPHDMRARSMAGKIYLDMHIHVPSHASVSEGHYLGDLVAYTIKQAHPQVEDVMVHIDTDEKIQTDSFIHEPTSEKPPQLKLPARHQILADLGFLLRQHAAYVDIPNTRLHYLNNHLNLEIIALSEKAPEGADLKRLTAGILLDLQTVNYIQTATVLWDLGS
ncbi:cation diffusion facilitator family transporter [Marinomonas ushuaiensis DSM 15871]|uniref:Cation diffusion facilitator family transporter n=1 Tax=Marinomonas ushuaiensis DSM 15871 TaxID=1122207 RepID=X7E5Z4_9GAMM|nr:cation diffusion facilitator family transporter [Marinomonas ushuaiensis]ETX11280.1 cation diffusion facilitator family transporter [Marinomonas ushuaiensis DSM 15871]